MPDSAPLNRLLNPQSLAVFGGSAAAEVVRQCRLAGFAGDIWVVNPKRSELEGLPCYRSLDELPAVPDASFVAVPSDQVVNIVASLAARGAGGAVCFTSGFAELDSAGKALQEALVQAAGDMPVIGPNCHGFVNYLHGAALWPDVHGGARVERGVALVSQSGNIAINLTLQDRSVAFSHVISVGNKACLGFHDYIDHLLSDDRVTAIGLHIEGLTDVAAFSTSALRALKKGVPLVAFKTGRSELGARMTMSHTGSLAGADKLFTALCYRLGIARCDSLPAFLETLKFLSSVGALPGDRVASLSCSGGEASIIADRAAALGLSMPGFSEPCTRTLRQLLGHRVHIDNPLDYHNYVWGDHETLRQCFTAVAGDGFDCTLLALDYPGPGQGDATAWEVAERALIEACETTGANAAVVSSLPENFPFAARQRLLAHGIAPMQGFDDCLGAVSAAVLTGRARQRVNEIRPLRPVVRLNGEGRLLDERQSKQALADAGLSVPAGAVCSLDEVAQSATALGYPVVVKALSAELAHKTDAGGVALNLATADDATRAAQAMAHLSSRFLVERCVNNAVLELLIGVSRDPHYGLVLLLGAGGGLVELIDDTATLLLPVGRAEIGNALDNLKCARLLNGYRGRPRGDREALLDAVQSVVAYAESASVRLMELDVNPLLVLPQGQGVVAVDALIRESAE